MSEINKYLVVTFIVCAVVILFIVYKKFFEEDSTFSIAAESEPVTDESLFATPSQEEVYNVGNNIFTYDDANAVCKAFDGRMANIDEVTRAHDKGAHWCNMGWTDGQRATFPVQKEEWDKLQKGPERRKNDCGIPGVSGGYFANDKMRFGVNCYGVKPSQREIDEVYAKYSDLLHDEEDSEQEKIDEFVRQKDDIFILPFNKSKWNR